MLTIRIAPEREEYVEQESIAMSVEVLNESPESIDTPEPAYGSNPQPVFEITGPSFPDGKQFNTLSAARERGDAEGLAAPPTIKLAPGAKWQGSAMLTQMLGQLAPGEYTVRAAYNWQGKTARSEEQRIRVTPLQPKSVHAGQGMRPMDSGEGRVVFLNPAGGTSSLTAFVFHETRPDKGEIDITPPIAQFKAGAQATDLSATWTNGAYFEELLQWSAWREGRNINVISDASTSPITLMLPSEPSFLVRPALRLKGRPIETLVVGSDQQLYLGSFPVDLNPKSAAKLVWQSRLPAQPIAAVAALAPQGNDSRHLAFVAANGQGIDIYHSSYRDSLAPFRSVRVPDVSLAPNVSPALMVDSSGTARVTVIVRSKDGKSYSAVEAQFKNSGGSAGDPAVLPLGAIDQPVKGGAVLYAEKAGKLQRREIALLVASANPNAKPVLRRWMTNAAKWKVLAEHVTPVEPVILVPGESYSYALCYATGQGFYFEQL